MSSYESFTSASPPLRRLSGTNSSSKEDLINAFEAEEERIINVLSRKLEQLQREKILLERQHEEESEARVIRLTKELEALRRRVRIQEGEVDGESSASASGPSSNGRSPSEVEDPSSQVLLTTLRKENEELRSRVIVAEREFVRLTRINEVYREELIEHRRRLGLSVDNLIGLSPMADPYSQPLHRRTSSTGSSSPTSSMIALPGMQSRPSNTSSMPIPRAAQVYRSAHKSTPSISETPISQSSSLSNSPFTFSPLINHNPQSYASASTNFTNLTTPESAASLQAHPPAPYGQAHTNGGPSLTYPSNPPPSLSSSLGSPTISYYIGTREPPSPVESIGPVSRRPSLNANGMRRVVESGNLRDLGLNRSRRGSVERGGRVAESGTLVRSRASSNASTPATNPADSPVLGVFIPSLNETIE